jgi:hypothetical protein
MIDYIKKKFFIFLLIKLFIWFLSIFVIWKYILFYIHMWYFTYFDIPSSFINIWKYDHIIITFDIIYNILIYLIAFYFIIYFLYLFSNNIEKKNNSKILKYIIFYSSPFILILIEHFISNWLDYPDWNTWFLMIYFISFYILYYWINNKDFKLSILNNKWPVYLVILFCTLFLFMYIHKWLMQYWKYIAENTSINNNYLNIEYKNDTYIIFSWDDNQYVTKKVNKGKLEDWVFLINHSSLEWIKINKWGITIKLDK